MERTNALAELAERLDIIIPYIGVSCTVCETDKHLTSKRAKDFVVIAQRIVAEVAKASDRKDDHGIVMSYSDVVGTIERCRAIAEEGGAR